MNNTEEIEELERLIEELNQALLKAPKEEREKGSKVAMELFKGIDYLNREK